MARDEDCEGFSCFTSLLKNLIHFFFSSVENVGVVPWCIFWWLVWFYIHWTYKWVFIKIFKKTCIQEEKYELLIQLYWKIAFASLSVPFALGNLQLDYIDLSDRFYYVLENHISRWISPSTFSHQIKMSYVILSGFYLNNICEVCCEFGFYSKEFLLNELLGLFFIATYPLRCVPFGLATIVLINLVDCFATLSEMLVCLGVIAGSRLAKNALARGFFTLHAALWLLVYFYLLPVYFLKALYVKMAAAAGSGQSDARQAAMFLFLSLAFLAYLTLYLLFSPMTKAIYSFVLGSEVQTEEEEVEERQPCTEPVCTEEDSHVGRSRNLRKAQNLRLLYQTVKCVIRMRRKLAKLRESKQADLYCEEKSVLADSSLENVNEDENSVNVESGSHSLLTEETSSWSELNVKECQTSEQLEDDDDEDISLEASLSEESHLHLLS